MKFKTLQFLTVATTVLVALLVNAAVGAAIAAIFGFSAWKGAVVANLVAISCFPIFPRTWHALAC